MQIVLYADNNVIEVYQGVINPKKTPNGIKWENGALEGIMVNWCLLHDNVSISPDELITNEFVIANHLDPPPDDIDVFKKQQADLVFELMVKGVL